MSKRTTFEQYIAEEGRLIYTNVGDSMFPFIQPGDLLVIERPEKPLRRWDIPLYKRPNGQYVLHRVVDILDDGSFVTRGDNRDHLEYGITARMVIGVLTGLIRGGETLSVDAMTDSFLLRSAYDLMYLVSCALDGTDPDPARCAAMRLPTVCTLARGHSLACAAAVSLERLPEPPRDFEVAKAKAIRRTALYDIELASVLRGLEEAGVRYIPLKGLVLRDMYPKTAMREMVDADVLIDADKAQQVKALMESLGFSCILYDRHFHDTYVKESGVIFEMHRDLFSSEDDDCCYPLFTDILSRSIPDGGMRMRMTDADCCRFLIAHAYRHYTAGGTGLRILADIAVYLRATELDPDGIFADADPRLSAFGNNLFTLSEKVFSDQSLTAAEEKMLLYMIRSGSHGVPENAEQNRLEKALDDDSEASKRRYLLRRIFLSEKDLRRQYPLVCRHRILYPLLLFRRAARGLLSHPQTLLAEYRAVKRFHTRDDQ